MRILVTGGAGYIGSHTVAELVAHGHEVTVVDNLRQGHREALRPFPSVAFHELSLQDESQMVELMRSRGIEAVVHFAASSLVGESVQKPLAYYRNNLCGTEHLLSAMVAAKVDRIVFSSTAAVYGEPSDIPILESSQKQPTNPYGETKLGIERMLHWSSVAYGVRSASLRYFNAAGAHPSVPIGEDHNPETHLIPLVLQVALGQREAISVFGTDYGTADGTCIRDYIHVCDLATAHRLALEWLETASGAHAFNLGNGSGFSVKQVIDASRKVTGRSIAVREVERRAGDPAVLVASPALAEQTLGWRRDYTNLEAILETAWRWHESHPHGYSESLS